jgi:hypothetical protein
MKPLLPLTLAALVAVPLLSGCPDNKVPKAPPIPAPKAAMHSMPDAPRTPHASAHALPRGIGTQA